MTQERFSDTRFAAMVEQALTHEQEPGTVIALRPAPARRRAAYLAPAMAALAACFMFVYLTPPAPQAESTAAQIEDISDSITYEMIDDLSEEA